MPDGAGLYASDFFAWTRDQAARLRALNSGAVDTVNLAREIEDMGGSDRRAAISFLRLIAEHALKLEFHPAAEYRRHWMSQIDNFRLELEVVLADSPSLRAMRAEMFARAWPLATRKFGKDLERDAPAVAAWYRRQPGGPSPRYDLDREILNEDWFPAPHPLD